MKVYEITYVDKTKEKVIVDKKENVANMATKEIKSVAYVGLESELRGQAKYRTSKGLFRYYQPNEKDPKNKFGDCVLRALCCVTGNSWLQVFDELTPIARKMQCSVSWDDCFEEYLKHNGFEYVGLKAIKGEKRHTVKTFTELNKKGTYFLKVANHAVASVNGLYYDTWDSGDKCVYGYWKKV